MSFSPAERTELESWIEIIWDQAKEFGLDPYPTHFEVVPQHVIYELGAYGLPARFLALDLWAGLSSAEDLV